MVEEDKNQEPETVRGLLDIYAEDLTAEQALLRDLEDSQGALVRDIGDGSVAAFTDIFPLDVVLEANGVRVADAADLRAKVKAIRVGEEINLTLIRSSKRIKTTLPGGQIEIVTSRSKETPIWLKLKRAEDEFRDGDPFAVDECLVFCNADDATIPDWVVVELARRSRVRLGIEEDPLKQGGRLSDAAKQNDSLQRKIRCCAVHAARKHGFKKEESYDKAQWLLAKCLNSNHARETIKRSFLNYGSNYDPESIWVLWFDMALEALKTLQDDEIAEEFVRETLTSLVCKKPL